MNYLQIAILAIIALSGIPVGLILKRSTKEEMKPGRKWFKIISIASFVLILLSPLSKDYPFYMSVFGFIFFISSIPLIRRIR